MRSLTTAGRESKAALSPDGANVAFIGEYGGPRGVFVMPITGGEPRRLTSHPADLGNTVCWTPDGTRILFSSWRDCSVGRSLATRLFTVSAEGEAATAVPLARAVQGALSPNERREWSNDFNPIWVGETIYFLSDRNGPVTLFAYDVKSREVRQIVENEGLNMKSAAAFSETIVYEQFGSLHWLDMKSGRDRKLDIRPVGDFPEVRPHFENAAEWGVTGGAQEKIKAKLSPSGARAVLEVRGRIVTVPAKNGDIRVLTQSPGVAERDPAWSPNSRWIAYTKQLPSHLHAVFVHSIEEGESHPLTDGMSDARDVAFDRGGPGVSELSL